MPRRKNANQNVYIHNFFSATFILSDFNPYLLSYRLFGKTNTKYNLTRHLTWMIPNDLYIWKLTCCVFLNKREVLSHFFGKYNIFKYFSTCLTRSYDFWIMNAMCTFTVYISLYCYVHVFVVYFSFAPVISASIHRSVSYFDIQVLMMVTETETLTSTLHHNIFTYLDYVFSATFIYIYMYIYIYNNKYWFFNIIAFLGNKIYSAIDINHMNLTS